jgi:hypothetical protein
VVVSKFPSLRLEKGGETVASMLSVDPGGMTVLSHCMKFPWIFFLLLHLFIATTMIITVGPRDF